MSGVVIGLKDIHYAVLTSDDETGVVYSTPKKIPGAMNATITPNVSSATLYADDGAADTASNLNDIAVEISTKDLPRQVQADLLGHTATADGGLLRGADDVAPYVALGFRTVKSNGKYRYIWLFKGKFQPHAQNYQTKGETPSFQTPSISGVFLKREFDSKWQYEINEDEESVEQSVITDFFKDVYDGTPVV